MRVNIPPQLRERVHEEYDINLPNVLEFPTSRRGYVIVSGQGVVKVISDGELMDEPEALVLGLWHRPGVNPDPAEVEGIPLVIVVGMRPQFTLW